MGFYVRSRGPIGFSIRRPGDLFALPFLLLALFIQGLAFAAVNFGRASVPMWRLLGRAIVSSAVWVWRMYAFLFRQAWKLAVIGYRRIQPRLRG